MFGAPEMDEEQRRLRQLVVDSMVKEFAEGQTRRDGQMYARQRHQLGVGLDSIAKELTDLGYMPEHFRLHTGDVGGGTTRIHGSLLRRWFNRQEMRG